MTRDVQECDVVVVGHGIAGLAAAVSALEAGARVAVLERAPRAEAGGNTRWTEAFMRMKSPDEVADDLESHLAANAGAYLDPSLVAETARDYGAWPAVVRAHAFADPELVGTLAAQAPPTLRWLQSLGIAFSPMATYLLTQSTTRIMPSGGGLQLVETLTAEAERRGAALLYETTARALVGGEAGVGAAGVRATRPGGRALEVRARAVVLACGGFEGNPEMLARYVGPKARWIRPVARGGYHNKGEGILMGLAAGAAPAGDFTEFHAEPIDPRSGVSEPIVFCFPYGILVNRRGDRFVDEASHTVDAIYEAVTRRINEQPEGLAWCVLDSRIEEVPGWRRSVRSDQPPVTAETIEALAQRIGVPAAALRRTVDAFNAGCAPGAFRPLEPDGLSTRGLDPPKSNWARPIAAPPFLAWPITCANCFTFGGLKTDARACVIDTSGEPIPGLYAAGETAGLYHGAYTGATSVLRGAVFGRIAGRDAARLARAGGG
jgi:tricarballylate dehydrogenase